MKLECNIKTAAPPKSSEDVLNDILNDFEEWIHSTFSMYGILSMNVSVSDGDRHLASSEYLRGFKDKDKEEC